MSKNALDFFEKYGNADKIYDEYAMHIEHLVDYKSQAALTVRCAAKRGRGYDKYFDSEKTSGRN